MMVTGFSVLCPFIMKYHGDMSLYRFICEKRPCGVCCWLVDARENSILESGTTDSVELAYTCCGVHI